MEIKREDLQVGKYYVGYWSGYGVGKNEVIIKLNIKPTSSTNPCIDSVGRFSNGSCLTAQDIKFRAATYEEIHWIDECILAGETIPKSKIKINPQYEIY